MMPSKPWEGNNFNTTRTAGDMDPVWGGTLGSQSIVNPSMSGVVGSGVRPVVSALGPGSAPPPLPQRSFQRNSPQSALSQPYSRYMNSPFGMGVGGYPYSSPYGGYPRRMFGGYGMGYSGFGPYQDDCDASMMQAIDNSWQTLFGPFDSLVRSIGSIAMVLDSTHQAMQFSFRTVLSAADSLSKLKNIIIELASSFSIIRLLRVFYYKILRLLGLINSSKLKEKEWLEAFSSSGASANSAGVPPNQNQPSPWLALGFFSLMMGGPYFMFKLFAQNPSNSDAKLQNGLNVGPDCVDTVAFYDFDATNNQELSMKRGDRLKIARSSLNQSWALATNGRATGYVPTNRLTFAHQGQQKVVSNHAPGPRIKSKSIPTQDKKSPLPTTENSSYQTTTTTTPSPTDPSSHPKPQPETKITDE